MTKLPFRRSSLSLALMLITPGVHLLSTRPPQAQSAAVEIPSTPAGQQFGAWYAAFNSGDKAQIEALISHFANPGERRSEGMQGFRRQTGGFDLKKIESSSDTKITGLVQERSSDQMARFVMEVDAA